MMRHTRTVAAGTPEPVSLAEAVAHLRSNGSAAEQSLISQIVSAAREYCEQYTGRALRSETVTAYPEDFEQGMQLPVYPVQSVTSITYLDAQGQTQTMAATDYVVETDTGRVFFKATPKVDASSLTPITIVYTAGYATIPPQLKQAVLLMCGHYYSNREAVQTGNLASIQVELTMQALLRQYKGWWF